MRLSLDLETFFSKTYTLKKGKHQHTTAEYIRSPEFLIHGGSYNIDRGHTQWLNREPLIALFKSLNWDDIELVAHHGHFEGFILSEHFGIKPKRIRCTLSMSRAINQTTCRHDLYSVATHLAIPFTDLEEALYATEGLKELPPDIKQALAVYCNQDVDIADAIDNKLGPLFPSSELELIDFTIKLFTEPTLLVDHERATKAMDTELAEKAALMAKVGCDRKDLTSNPKFAKILETAGIAVPMKISPTTGLLTHAFAKGDSAFLDLRDSPDEKTRDLIAARITAKSNQNENKTARLLKITTNNKTWPTYLNYYGAHTGRPSGGDKLNPLNMKRNSELRKSIIAPPGYRLVVADSAQIEARFTAWLADEHTLLDAFRNNEDVYSKFAGDVVYHRPVTKANELERFVGKVCILGLGFGMGPPKFKATLAAGALGGPRVFIDIPKATEIVYGYRGMYPSIPELWKFNNNILWAMTNIDMAPIKYKCLEYNFENIELPNGMSLYYPMLGEDMRGDLFYHTQEGGSKIYGGLATENIVQALARIAVTEQLQIINRRWRVVLFTYDEIVALAPDNEADECLEFMLKTMATSPTWAPDVPLKAEGGHETFYSK